jgi:hypothetical protein
LLVSFDVPSMSRPRSTDESEWVAAHQHSWNDETSLVETVVRALVAATDDPPESFTPIHRCVDVDALERIFAPRPDGTPRPDTAATTFVVDDHEVLVESSGRVAVRPVR